MWPGVEPAQGEFSDVYIKKLKIIVNAAAKRGIYTLLDMHQDVLSENFCGEGKSFFRISYNYFRLHTRCTLLGFYFVLTCPPLLVLFCRSLCSYQLFTQVYQTGLSICPSWTSLSLLPRTTTSPTQQWRPMASLCAQTVPSITGQIITALTRLARPSRHSMTPPR